MRLLKASPEQTEGLIEFLREVGRGEDGFGGVPEVFDGRLSIEAYLEREAVWSQGRDLPPGRVPQTTYWLRDGDGRVAGMSRLRHHLTDELLHHGGHIGYYIHPTYRGKGHGKTILALTLQEARNLGIDRVLITVGTGNEHSIRVVEANGGVMEDERVETETGLPFRRYWIDIS